MTPIELHRNPSINSQWKSTHRLPHDIDGCRESVSVIAFNQGH